MQANKLIWREITMQDVYLHNTDLSFNIKKLDNSIQRKILSIFDNREFADCSLQNMWITDYLFHMEIQGKTTFQKDIEAEFSINRATASKMLSLMEEKQLISRANSDKDGRLKALTLMPRGRELQGLCYFIRTEIEKQLTQSLSDEEVRVFKELIARAMGNMG